MAASTVPAVLDALVVKFRAALQGATVSDGQPTNLEEDLVAVGFTGEVGEPAVQTTLDRAQLAAEPDREQYGVICMVSSWKGVRDDEATIKLTRDRAFEMVGLMKAELARDPRLGELVMSARLATTEFTQYYTGEGVSADIQVLISIDAFTR